MRRRWQPLPKVTATKARAKKQEDPVELAKQFIQRVRNEPTWFAREVLNHKAKAGEPTIEQDPKRSWELDTFQAELLEACADVWRKRKGIPTRINHEGKEFITVRSGRGPGKTHTAAMIALWFVTAFKGRVICTAPKLAQLRTRVWTALRRIDSRAEGWWRSTHIIHDTSVAMMDKDKDTGKLSENKDWGILAETASSAESLSGFHAPVQLVIVEEATGVKEQMFPSIFGATGLEWTIFLFISNPTQTTGTFADSHLKKREESIYFRYHVSLHNARRIDRKWAANLERKYGEKSPVVAVNVHGEFTTAAPNQLIALEWITQAWQREFIADGSLAKFVVSVDVADGGEDKSVITVGQHYQTLKRMRRQVSFSFPAQESPIRLAEEAVKLWNEFGCSERNGDYFVVDSLGVGSGTAGELMRLLYPVVTYKGGEASANTDRWRNRRVQSYNGLRDDFRDGLIVFDDDFCPSDDAYEDEVSSQDELMAQLCSIKTRPSSERVDDLVTREQMRADGLTSPDRADSLAMQYATQAPRTWTGPQVSIPQPRVVEAEFKPAW